VEDETVGAPILTRRCYASFVGRPRQKQKHPLAENPFAQEFVDWMDSPEGHSSIEVSDVLWDLMEDVQLDARQRKIIWPEGKGLSIDESVERIHKLYPDFPSERIASFLTSWIEQYAPDSYSEERLDELDRLTEEWLDQYERQVKPPAKRPKTRHS
jgi:hypothetical protein